MADGTGDAGRGEQARREVDRSATWSRHDPSGGEPPGPVQDQRHAHDLVEERLLVPLAAVLEELLAVVGGDDDEGVLEEPALAQRAEDLAEDLVGEADLAVVERDQVLAVARLHRGAHRGVPHEVDPA